MGSLKLRRGDSANINLEVLSEGVVFNLTGCTLFFTVRTAYATTSTDDTDAVLTKDVTSHTSPTAGLSTIELTDTDTDIEARKYKYDVQLKDTNNYITTIDIGDLTVLPHVTVRTA